jgi:hypothetical protein
VATFSEIVDPNKNNTIVSLISTREGFILATASEVYVIIPHADGTKTVEPMEFVTNG